MPIFRLTRNALSFRKAIQLMDGDAAPYDAYIGPN